MIAVLSPAKSLDFTTPPSTELYSTGDFLDQADLLVERARQLKPKQLSKLMSISDKLAELNHERFAEYEAPLEPSAQTKQAALAFTGDTYVGFDAPSMSDDDLAFAQQHVRILSGLYGLLRPMDLIRPYRLEMGSSLKNSRGKNLYAFWGDRLGEALGEALEESGSRVVVKCASNEYFSAVEGKIPDARVITPVFKDWKNGQYKIISFYAKQARGAMAAHMVRNRITSPDELKTFDWGGYAWSEDMSDGDEWVFVREAPTPKS